MWPLAWCISRNTLQTLRLFSLVFFNLTEFALSHVSWISLRSTHPCLLWTRCCSSLGLPLVYWPKLGVSEWPPLQYYCVYWVNSCIAHVCRGFIYTWRKTGVTSGYQNSACTHTPSIPLPLQGVQVCSCWGYGLSRGSGGNPYPQD